MTAQAGGPYLALVADGQAFPYGYGISGSVTKRGVQTLHLGHIDGFSSYMRRYGDDGLTVVVLSNLASTHVDEIANQVAALTIDTTVQELVAR